MNGVDTSPNAEIAQQDPGEPSSTTEDSQEIETKTKKRARTNSNAKSSINAGIADDNRTMKAPPKGIVHPAGYRTNDPPVGRDVRVYADGVFDLFHLGYVQLLSPLPPQPLTQ